MNLYKELVDIIKRDTGNINILDFGNSLDTDTLEMNILPNTIIHPTHIDHLEHNNIKLASISNNNSDNNSDSDSNSDSSAASENNSICSSNNILDDYINNDSNQNKKTDTHKIIYNVNDSDSDSDNDYDNKLTGNWYYAKLLLANYNTNTNINYTVYLWDLLAVQFANNNDDFKNIKKLYYKNELDLDTMYEFETDVAKHFIDNIKIQF